MKNLTSTLTLAAVLLLSNLAVAGPALLKWPKYPGTDYYFSYYSHRDQVCRLLGYSSSAPNSKKPGDFVKDTIEVDFGKFKEAPSELPIRSIICIDKVRKPSGPKFVVIEWPKEPGTGMPFHWRSFSQGICRALGYPDSLTESTYYTGEVKREAVEVDETGYVENVEYGKVVNSVTCRTN